MVLLTAVVMVMMISLADNRDGAQNDVDDTNNTIIVIHAFTYTLRMVIAVVMYIMTMRMDGL